MKGWSRTKSLDSPAVAPGDADKRVHGGSDPIRVVSEEVEIFGGPVDQLEWD